MCDYSEVYVNSVKIFERLINESRNNNSHASVRIKTQINWCFTCSKHAYSINCGGGIICCDVDNISNCNCLHFCFRYLHILRKNFCNRVQQKWREVFSFVVISQTEIMCKNNKFEVCWIHKHKKKKKWFTRCQSKRLTFNDAAAEYQCWLKTLETLRSKNRILKIWKHLFSLYRA